MSGIGALQEKMTGAFNKLPPGARAALSPVGPLEKYTPHQQAAAEQEKLNKQAAELEAQQTADAASAATLGPQAMGVRRQEDGASVMAGGTAGGSLFANRRPRGAARRSISGY